MDAECVRGLLAERVVREREAGGWDPITSGVWQACDPHVTLNLTWQKVTGWDGLACLTNAWWRLQWARAAPKGKVVAVSWRAI